jgi:hypothetical protein
MWCVNWLGALQYIIYEGIEMMLNMEIKRMQKKKCCRKYAGRLEPELLGKGKSKENEENVAICTSWGISTTILVQKRAGCGSIRVSYSFGNADGFPCWCWFSGA